MIAHYFASVSFCFCFCFLSLAYRSEVFRLSSWKDSTLDLRGPFVSLIYSLLQNNGYEDKSCRRRSMPRSMARRESRKTKANQDIFNILIKLQVFIIRRKKYSPYYLSKASFYLCKGSIFACLHSISDALSTLITIFFTFL